MQVPSGRRDVVAQFEALSREDPLAPEAGLTARIAGAGPDVVLVHGSLGDYRQWDPIARQLLAHYRIVTLSRRFHWPRAAAPDGAAAYTYEGHRDDLLRYLRRRGAQPVHLVGHSYGAGIVLLAALAEPALVRSVVLMEPALNSLLPTASPGLEEELASRNAMAADVRSLALAGDNEVAARRLIDWVQGNAGEFATLPAWVQAALLDNAMTAGPTIGHPAPDVTCPQLRDLDVPALVVTGSRTRLYYRLIAARVAQCLPNAATASLPGAAHMTIVERPVEAAAMLSSFLAAQTGPHPAAG